MAPFIKFTEKVGGKDGSTVYWRYVNAAAVDHAKYHTENKVLWLTIGKEQFELTGDEAEAALAILQKL